MVRFWSHVEKNGDCWNWTGCRYHTGYGCVRIPHSRKNTVAHRMAWILTYGAISEGLQVNHKCDNPACCNPDHLYLGTQCDNMRDAFERGRRRGLAGEENPRSKITHHDAEMIRARQLLGETYSWLAAEYGVCIGTIGHITANRTWGVDYEM